MPQAKIVRIYKILAFVILVMALSCRAPAPNKLHFLWKVQSDKHFVYLMGSLHLAPPDLHPLPPALELAFDQCNYLALELEVDGAEMDSARELLANWGMLENGYRLNKLLDKNTNDALLNALLKLQMDTAAAFAMRPWMLAMQVGVQALERSGLEAGYGLDMYFWERAQASEKPVLALEKGREQAKVFYDLPWEEEVQYLRQTLQEMDSLPVLLNMIFSAWRRGDAAALENLLFTGKPHDTPLLQERLYANRNIAMAQKVHHWLKEGKTVFVVVGAGHLVGKQGLPNLLKKMGYGVTQVRSL